MEPRTMTEIEKAEVLDVLRELRHNASLAVEVGALHMRLRAHFMAEDRRRHDQAKLDERFANVTGPHVREAAIAVWEGLLSVPGIGRLPAAATRHAVNVIFDALAGHAKHTDMLMALSRAKTACLHRHAKLWDRMVVDHDPDGDVSFTQEQINMARTVLRKLAHDLDECDPRILASEVRGDVTGEGPRR